ncbi:MAG: addiction module protein [Undibacterium sp.]|nr:addiction module protein [Opitutaceae bacterium]
MKLPRKKRVLLAERLMESLETKREKEIAEVGAGEAADRAAVYHAGKLKAVPLRQAFGSEA